jgi:sugar phosphate isomerase/epimerase
MWQAPRGHAGSLFVLRNNMDLAISTRWNGCRHREGEPLVEEILSLGLDRIELGFDLTSMHAEGVRRMVEKGAVRVTSVHSYCPVPIGASRGHPEIWELASTDERERQSAVRHTHTTMVFAAGMGASCVVSHAGNVRFWRAITPRLVAAKQNAQWTEEQYERLKTKLLLKREGRADAHIRALETSLDELVPLAKQEKVKLSLELLPAWEAVPNEREMDGLLKRYPGDSFAYWHDMGHGAIRENLGFSAHLHSLRRVSARMAGMHVHDVEPPARDHLPPGEGKTDFKAFREVLRPDLLLVMEPSPGTDIEAVKAGVKYLRNVWGDTASS